MLALIDKMVKQRRDAETQYRDAGRDELADAEAAEVVVLETYLPDALSDQELADLVAAAVTQSRCAVHAGHGQGHGHSQAPSAGPGGHGRGQRRRQEPTGLADHPDAHSRARPHSPNR